MQIRFDKRHLSEVWQQQTFDIFMLGTKMKTSSLSYNPLKSIG